ncbi:hypothetical protein IP88_02770 [alpha proteobacterium AAP81b]|nr:hypothetical protein IP88_02770 [alpha proteobacterium AAP81b]
MGIVDKLFEAMKTTIEMRGDIDRNSEQLKSATDALLDHEKRLVRLETRDELRVISLGRASRPGDE